MCCVVFISDLNILPKILRGCMPVHVPADVPFHAVLSLTGPPTIFWRPVRCKLGLMSEWHSQVLRSLRVDRVTVAAASFVAVNLGEQFVRPPVLDYKDLLQRSSPLTPIIFVLSPGADPAFGIFRLGGGCSSHSTSLISP